jgi:hypothetical protein
MVAAVGLWIGVLNRGVQVAESRVGYPACNSEVCPGVQCCLNSNEGPLYCDGMCNWCNLGAGNETSDAGCYDVSGTDRLCECEGPVR